MSLYHDKCHGKTDPVSCKISSQIIISNLLIPEWNGKHLQTFSNVFSWIHDDVIKWKHFLRYWPFVRGIHWSPVNSPHKGQWCGALMFCLICVWINSWINNRKDGDLRRYRAHYDDIVMKKGCILKTIKQKKTEVCTLELDWQWVSICWGDGLMLNKCCSNDVPS